MTIEDKLEIGHIFNRLLWAVGGLVVTLGLASLPLAALAITSDFSIQLSVGSESNPPTIPDPISAVAIASTQIDVSWGASTDDSAVAGYVLHRNGSPIATTTLLSYSDAGLTPSTSYTYFVTAFDIFGNISDPSATTSATTLPPPPPTSSGGGSGGEDGEEETPEDVPLLNLLQFSVNTGTRAANFLYQMDGPTQFVLRYGISIDYELGSLSGMVFQATHHTLVDNLEPDTTYRYELFAYDNQGREYLISRDSFTTLTESGEVIDPPDPDDPVSTEETEDPTSDTSYPLNVSNFIANRSGNDVILSWTNPTTNNFSHVRLLRSHLFYPTDPNDGFLVYEGTAKEFIDTGALAGEVEQFYTLFTYDLSGNHSSGAIARISREPGESIDPVDLDSLSLYLVQVVQRGLIGESVGGRLFIDTISPFRLRIPYSSLPEHLKVITVTIQHPTDPNRVFSYIMTANRDFTFYETPFSQIMEPGEYGLVFTVFDFYDERLASFSGKLVVTGQDMTEEDALLGNPLLSWPERILPERFAEAPRRVLETPVGAAVTVTTVVGGLGLGFMALLSSIASQLSSLASLQLLPLHLWHLFMAIIGFRRKLDPWGVVYDSETKQPLDPAYITIYDLKGREVSNSITDLDGRYGFHVKPGVYRLLAKRSNYVFPSAKLLGKRSDNIYNDLYFGETVTVTDSQAVINKNIPLDPTKFDWNEFEKQDKKLLKFYSARARRWRRFSIWGFRIGFAVAVLVALVIPTPFNAIAVLFYLFALYLRRVIGPKPTGSLTLAATGEPLSFARVRILSAKDEQEIQKRIANKYGEYYCLLRPGNYIIEISRREADGSYTPIHKIGPRKIRGGVYREDLSL